MIFQLTEEQLMVQQAAKDFAKEELLPGVIERDEKQSFPGELREKMGQNSRNFIVDNFTEAHIQAQTINLYFK